ALAPNFGQRESGEAEGAELQDVAPRYAAGAGWGGEGEHDEGPQGDDRIRRLSPRWDEMYFSPRAARAPRAMPWAEDFHPFGLKIVLSRSGTLTGSVVGAEADLSVAPRICPGLTPPPANTTLWAIDQWSRPASLFTRGVRPISPISTTSVVSSRPRWSRSSINALNARSTCGSMSFSRLGKIVK